MYCLNIVLLLYKLHRPGINATKSYTQTNVHVTYFFSLFLASTNATHTLTTDCDLSRKKNVILIQDPNKSVQSAGIRLLPSFHSFVCAFSFESPPRLICVSKIVQHAHNISSFLALTTHTLNHIHVVSQHSLTLRRKASMMNIRVRSKTHIVNYC